MEQGLSRDANISSANKDVPLYYGTCKLITMFKRTCHLYVFNQTNLVHMFPSCFFEDPFLGTFAKLWKATTNFF